MSSRLMAINGYQIFDSSLHPYFDLDVYCSES